MSSNSNASSGTTASSDIDIISVSNTWQSIYVALVLTSLQIALLLVWFEVARRRLPGVYERRRLQYPSKTPPPLRQRWYPTWWNFKLTDTEYNDQSWNEANERDEQKKRHKKKRQNDDSAIVRQADEYCRKSVPFFRDMTEEELNEHMEGGEETVTTNATSLMGEEPSVRQELPENDGKYEFSGDNGRDEDDEEEEEVWDADDIEITLKMKQGDPVEEAAEIQAHQTFVDFPSEPIVLPSKRAPVTSRHRSLSLPIIVDQKTDESSIQTCRRSTSKRRQSRSEHDDQAENSVPLIIGGAPVGDSSARRRVRFDSVYATQANMTSSITGRTQIRTDVTVGSQEADRLARLRYQQDDVRAQWDKHVLNRMFTFLKTRILVLRDDEAEDDASDGQEHKKYLSRQVMRRPLSMEDQEMLRCVGLDAFVILQFMRFSFDVFFWPMLLSLVTLMPIYLTGNNNSSGYWSTTIVALIGSTNKFWFVVAFEYIHFSYILRMMWIDWEAFMPLRYDFLEHGDFDNERYKSQYQMTCVVEYIPASHRNDKNLYQFFDSLFPNQIKRAEVLLNTEHLRKLIRDRLGHIIAYENVFAKMVHERADYLRDCKACENDQKVKQCCHVLIKPGVPKEPKKVVVHWVERTDMGNALFQPQTKMVKDPRTVYAREWHHRNIQRLNKEIDEEYIRLAQARRLPVPQRKETRIAKWLGIKYITGSDTSNSLHSSTGFVEFSSLEAKQAAIQCNLTGISNLVDVSPVPEIKDIIWANAHVSRALIQTRKTWVGVLFVGFLIGWSFLVTAIRSYTGFSDWLKWEALKGPSVAAFIEVYLPAFIVEGLVRIIPFILEYVSKWIRFKSASENDNFVLLWYFAFRLVTFIFILVGGSLVDSGADFIDNPLIYIQQIGNDVALDSQFFISYVLISGGMSTFFFMSQVHFAAEHWFVRSIITEEATSQRKLDQLNGSVKVLPKPEVVPLFLFIFIIGALYGAIAPIASVFVSFFYKGAYKVYKYLMLYVYGKRYENGGQLFYSLSTIRFFILYMVVLIIVGYLSLHGTMQMAGVFAPMLLIILATQIHVHRTFIVPSRKLSLAKALIIDNARGQVHQDNFNGHVHGFSQIEASFDGDNYHHHRQSNNDLMQSLLDNVGKDLDKDTGDASFGSDDAMSSESLRALADKRMQDRYRKQESVSDITDEYTWEANFFIYRQPSLNRATWELAPRPYRQQFDRDEHCEVWS